MERIFSMESTWGGRGERGEKGRGRERGRGKGEGEGEERGGRGGGEGEGEERGGRGGWTLTMKGRWSVVVVEVSLCSSEGFLSFF